MQHTKPGFSWRPKHISLQLSSTAISLIIALPILIIVTSLIQPGAGAWQHIRDTVLSEYLINTFWLMLQVTLYTLLIGVSTAWLTATTVFPGKRFFSWALMLPLAAPAYIIAYVYTDLLEFDGPLQKALGFLFNLEPGSYAFPEIRSLPGAAIVISLVLYPYVYLLAKVAFTQHSATLFDAARSLGASPKRAFFRIALPAARPAIIGGLSLVLMETLADFGVVDYFGVPTFSTGIFRTWFAMGEKAAAMKLAAVMFIFVIALIALEKSQRNHGKQAINARDGHFKPMQLTAFKGGLAFLICALPIVFGCILPLGVLAIMAVTEGDPLLGNQFIGYIKNSVQVSTMASVLAVLMAILLAQTANRVPNRFTRSTVQLATLGYALPGAMLAVGLLTPISTIDRYLAEFFDTQFQWQTGLILTGTTFTLIYAYLIRFLTVAFNSVSSGLNQIPEAYSHAAKSLGAPWQRILYKIHLPLMRRAVVTAAILVFVDTMRELPATLLLRPFNFETLATRVYRLASDERLAEASTAAITIVMIGLIPVLFLNRLSDKK